MSEPRVAPASPPYSESVQRRLEAIMPPGAPPLVLFRTLARDERLFDRFMSAGLLDRGHLSIRQRELAILRTCARSGSEYEWGVHVAAFAARAGLTDEEIEATTSASWLPTTLAPEERAIVALMDELHDTSNIGEASFNELRARFSDEQILELILLGGFYHTVAYLTNGLALPLEAFAVRFPDSAVPRSA